MAELTPQLLNTVTWMIPNALVLIGARSGDAWNGMTASWVTQVAMEPVLVAVSVDNSALTHRLISKSGAFSVNLWSSEDTRTFVKFSKPATKEGDSLNGRPVHEGVTGVPIFDEAIAWMECQVRQSVDLGSHTLFIGEIVDAAVETDDPGRAAAISDTSMKYGGVKRGGQ